MSGDQLTDYQEHFNSLPRVVLDCSVRDQIFPESQYNSLHNRLHSLKSEVKDLAFLLEQKKQVCESLQSQVRDLQGSRSWKITAPFRALGDCFHRS